MKTLLTTLFWFAVSGAFGGLLLASGIVGFFQAHPSDISNEQGWVTKEEYHMHLRRYPIYGAAAGIAIGLLLSLRSAPTKKDE